MAVTETYGSPQTPQPIDSHVQPEQERLGEETTKLLARLDELRSRLAPLLGELVAEANTSPAEVPPYRVAVAEAIREQRYCVERATEVVVDLLGRLRL